MLAKNLPLDGARHPAATEAPTPPPKNIVLCLDGTGNRIRAKGNTNVIRLFRALENTTGRQIVYYDPGVGTFSSAGSWTRVGRWWSRMLGLAFGDGIKTNLAEAYTFLMNHWEPGDRIYLFGFSRGAYTARALAGMLHRVGIPRPSSENLVQYAIAAYARNRKWTEKDAAEARAFATTVCRADHRSRRVDHHNPFSIQVHYLGVWDTVSAPGIFRRSQRFEGTRRLSNVRAGRHAVSIDERRAPYRVLPVDNRKIEEVWFAGVHSDVGGGLAPHQLADISLMWMLDGAQRHGLQLRDDRRLRKLPTLTPRDALGRVHGNGPLWALAGYRKREVAPDSRVHDSVRIRREVEPDYGKNLCSDPVWADRDWLKRRVSGPNGGSSIRTGRAIWGVSKRRTPA